MNVPIVVWIILGLELVLMIILGIWLLTTEPDDPIH